MLIDSVGRAMLVVLGTLPPAERVAFVLHDLFAVPFEQIAPIVERTPVAAKKLASRARQRVRGTSAVPVAEPALVNGAVGAVVASHGRLMLAVAFTVDGGRVSSYDVIADPARLRQLDLAVLDG